MQPGYLSGYLPEEQHLHSSPEHARGIARGMARGTPALLTLHEARGWCDARLSNPNPNSNLNLNLNLNPNSNPNPNPNPDSIPNQVRRTPLVPRVQPQHRGAILTHPVSLRRGRRYY